MLKKDPNAFPKKPMAPPAPDFRKLTVEPLGKGSIMKSPQRADSESIVVYNTFQETPILV